MLLRLGDHGEAVKQVQHALSIGEDGIFGPDTQTAVQQFQADHNLQVDGIVGDDTLRALNLDPDVLAQLDATGAGTTSTYPQGIDIYELNLDDPGAPTWDAILRAGFSFVFQRANEGSRQDATFTARWPQFAAAGLLRGAYYLPRPDTAANYDTVDAGLQTFLNAVGRLVPGDFGPVLDLEDRKLSDDSNPIQNAAFWVSAAKHLADAAETSLGRQPVIYTQRSWWVGYTNDAPGFGPYPIWVVDVNHTSAPVLPTTWSRWTWWQWHWEQSTSPMPNPFRQAADNGVDLDRFNGTLDEMRGLADLGRPTVAVGLILPGITQSAEYVAQTDSNGHVHLLAGPTWADADLSVASLPSTASDPALLVSSDSLFLYFRSGGHLVEAISSLPGTWQWQSSQIEDRPPVHDPRAAISDTTRWVVYWGDDDDWYLVRGDGSWMSFGSVLQNAGIRTAAGGQSTGQPNIYVTQQIPHLIGRVGWDGHLYDVWSDGSTWRWDDLTALGRDLAPEMPAATYCPCAYEVTSGVGVVFRAVGGNVWVMTRADNAPTNVTSVTGATTALGSPACLVFNDAPHIVYRGVDGMVYDLFLNGPNWAVQQVCTQKAASDPAAAAITAGGVVAFRKPDGSMQIATLDPTGWTCA